MDEDNKKVFKLVTKDKPPEETPGVTPNHLLTEGIDKYDDLILIGWKEDQFKISWSEGYSPEEVYLQLQLAKDRIMDKLFIF